MSPHLRRHIRSYLRTRPPGAEPMATAAIAAKMGTTTARTRQALQLLHTLGQARRTRSGRALLWESTEHQP